MRAFVALVILVSGALGARATSPSMQEVSQAVERSREYGRPNPNAPPALSQFAFLIGKWRCQSRVKGPDGSFRTHPATWIGRYILDGYVIADEFRQLGPDGELVQLGQNYRSFNRDTKSWVMRWHDALASTWLELGPEDLGGVQVDDTSISFKHHVPPTLAGSLFPVNTLFRVTFSDIADDQFTWRAEVSTDDGTTWELVQVIEARRAHN